MKKSGFTLWELLAVIIIVLFLVAILFPFGYGHHEKARQINCESNERQLGFAITQYAEDNDGNLPNIADAKDRKNTWRVMIYPYVKSTGVYKCLDRNEQPTWPNQKYDTLDGLPSSYAANFTGDYSGGKNNRGNGVFAGSGSKPVNQGEIKDPADLIELCEAWHSSTPDFNIDNLGAFNPRSDTLWAGHDNGSNYLFADGHYKYLRPLATKDFWHRNTSIPLSPGAVKVLQNAHLDKGG